MIKDRKQYRLIKRSGLFDRAYYLLTYPDVRKADINPLMHFIKIGWKEGRNPSSTFNTKDYLEKHPELVESGVNPLIHYIQQHQIKNQGFFAKLVKNAKYLWHYLQIKPSGLFDAKYYLETYPDVRRADIDPLMHFIKIGWKEGRNPSSTFSTKQYLEVNAALKNAAVNPLLHYHQQQKAKQTLSASKLSDLFSTELYDLSSDEVCQKLLSLSSKFPPRTTDIIIFPILDWNFRFQRPQQLASQFAKMGHRVFYLKAGLYYRPDKSPLIEKAGDNLFIVNLSGGNTHIDFTSHLSKENIEDLAYSLTIIKDHLLINSAIIKVDLPFWGNLAIKVKEEFGWKLVYDCMDLHSGFSDKRPSLEQEETSLLQISDIVLASSHLLYEYVKQFNKNAFLVPNGTDFEFFHQSYTNTANKDIHRYRHPIVGYYGAISDWFDTQLVGELASDHPEWTFVLIGDTHMADLNPLEGLPNLHLLGEKPYSQLPDYLTIFDVCIIPFKDIPLTNATNPVKLFEYLSAGKPVVSTRLNEISKYEEYVRLAKTKEEWEIAINKSLVEVKTPRLLKKRFDFAQQNTWEERAHKIMFEASKLFPKISVIVLSYNNLPYTRLCLESIIENTSYPNYEMIIVDNGSEKNTIKYLKHFESSLPRVKLILNDQNLGFSKANNQGFALSEGEYVVFLNNDTIVTPGWIHGLLYHLQANPSAGMVGPVTNSIGNEAKIDVPYTELGEINTFAAHRTKDYFGKAFKIRVLALYCAMISRSLFERVGGLDERYEIGMFEDDDLALNIKELGLDLICAEDVFIHHFHRVTFDKLGPEKFQSIFDENKQKFQEKWESGWIPHQHR